MNEHKEADCMVCILRMGYSYTVQEKEKNTVNV